MNMKANYFVQIENEYEEFSTYTMAKQFYDAFKNIRKARLLLGIIKSKEVIELEELL